MEARAGTGDLAPRSGAPAPLRGARIRRVVVAAGVLAAALGLAACGSGSGGGAGDDAGDTVTGRVVSIARDASRYCVSPDRGATRTCVDVPDPRAIDGVEVGVCVTTSPDLTSEGSRVEVVDEAACAAGDLGEPADGG